MVAGAVAGRLSAPAARTLRAILSSVAAGRTTADVTSPQGRADTTNLGVSSSGVKCYVYCLLFSNIICFGVGRPLDCETRLTCIVDRILDW